MHESHLHRPPSRLRSLDVFRGITVALMILVNSPGHPTTYAWLQHSAWDGCSFADLVFPFFIFIVGVASVFALTALKARGVTAQTLYPKLFKRAVILFSLGILLNVFPNHFDLANIRIFGVLQRIAVCYAVSAYLYLTTRIQTQLMIMVGLIVGYWLLMIGVPISHHPMGEMHDNLAFHLDRILIPSGHLYRPYYDPEGILSTFPAIATALFGNGIGALLLSNKPQKQIVVSLSMIGLVAMLAGWIWGFSFPINKSIWSSSYVLWTGGLATLVFAACYYLIEIKAWNRWCYPFEVFGKHALLAYCIHIVFLKLQRIILISQHDGTTVNLQSYLTQHCFGWASVKNASLLYAISYTLFWLLIVHNRHIRLVRKNVQSVP